MEGRTVVRPRNYFVGATALVLAGLVLGLGVSAGLRLPHASRATTAELASATSAAALPESPFVGIAAKALPAVVFIDVKKKMGGEGNDPGADLLRQFFDSPQMQHHPQTAPSSGSGFLIDDKGHIMTNNHVVSNASEITVTLNDGRDFKGHVVGTDPETDVAVIQIDGKDLPWLPLGDSDKLRPGDWAIAVGNPLGDQLRGSVTVGIISARGRTNLNIYGGAPDYQDFIQTDAAINFGNSGGPLCNIRGEVIGINTAINPSGQNLSFAVPINLAKHVAGQLVAHGSVRRAQLGVMLAEMTPDLAEGFGLAGQQGVIVSRVLENSPAAKAGMRRNDVIVEFDGQPVNDMQKLRIKVADVTPGHPVSLVVLRDGKRLTLSVTPKDKDEKLAANDKPGADDGTVNLGGLTVRDLRDDEKRQLGIESGVRVTAVADGSLADDAQIVAGDVVEMVGASAVGSADEFQKLMGAARRAGRPAVLYVTHGNSSRYVPLRLDK